MNNLNNIGVELNINMKKFQGRGKVKMRSEMEKELRKGTGDQSTR